MIKNKMIKSIPIIITLLILLCIFNLYRSFKSYKNKQYEDVIVSVFIFIIYLSILMFFLICPIVSTGGDGNLYN